MNQAIATPNAPGAIGPYSQGIAAGNMAFVSGQLPIDPATGAFAGEDIVSQTRQSLLNIKAILEENGMTMADVVKTTVLLADIGEFGAMNKDNEADRAEWVEYYIKAAAKAGIRCIWWDNGLFEGEGERFGLFDRHTYRCGYPKVLEGIQKGIE